jgi:L-glutamine-phosphate cytidylyltransferase
VNKRAIIVAAGRGSRLGPETAEIPKCMVQVGGRPILHWQLAALQDAGVDDVVIVRGYLGDRIDPGAHRVRFVENRDWPNNNILTSLMMASDEMQDGFFFSYSDIVFGPATTRALAAAPSAPATLVVDRGWAEAYEGRTLHPVSEAELADVQGHSVTRVGKQVVPGHEAAGEFIGLARFEAAGVSALKATWARAMNEGGLEAPFGRATALRKAYLTDALNAMASAGVALAPVFIDGAWREIDTEQDLANAESVVERWSR